MNILPHKSILAVIALFFSINLTAQVQEVTFVVQVPNEEDTLYITGNQPSLGDWYPAAVMMKKISKRKRSITLSLNFPAEFKFTRGNWDKEGYIGDKYDTQNILLNKPVKKANYNILGWYDEGNFFFDENYILANKGRHSIEIPEVQELLHIVFALTATGVEDKNLVEQEGEYYKKVMKEFGQYKSDPFVLKINSLLKEGKYAILKMDACGFNFDGNRIVKDKAYNKLSWGGPNSLEPYIQDLEKFGKKINFRSFYAGNHSFYEKLTNRMEELASVKEQWEWLENNFYDTYDNYRITFSPLVNGSHSTNKFIQSDFKQTVMFIRSPVEDEKYSEELKKGIMSTIIFTEIDHNYVNPVSDQFENEIKAAMPNLPFWAAPQALQYYNNEYMVFNEYMTWGVFTLYAREKFEKEDFEQLISEMETMMAERRGFSRFKEFNKKLVDLYDNKKTDQKIPDLYPEIISYFKNTASL